LTGDKGERGFFYDRKKEKLGKIGDTSQLNMQNKGSSIGGKIVSGKIGTHPN